jgi:hypothetical protein
MNKENKDEFVILIGKPFFNGKVAFLEGKNLVVFSYLKCI